MNGKKLSVSMMSTLMMALVMDTTPARAFTLKKLHATAHLGGYISSQGKAQNINIEGLIGDAFSVTKSSNGNVLLGLGLFVDGQKTQRFELSYGVDAFFLPQSPVSGIITQEQLFTNLSYRYNVSNIPVYAAVKSIINTSSSRYAVTLDAGIGPNFMSTSDYQDYSLDGITIPDNAFEGRSNTAFSATAGIGVRLNNLLGQVPLECGYRFFYLGQGGFNKRTTQLLNNLTTGTGYANALLCSITV